MIRKTANIILEDSSLAVNKDFGLKVGLAVEENGMQKDVLMEFIEVIQKMHSLNSV
jgi:hypothetical protein